MPETERPVIANIERLNEFMDRNHLAAVVKVGQGSQRRSER